MQLSPQLPRHQKISQQPLLRANNEIGLRINVRKTQARQWEWFMTKTVIAVIVVIYISCMTLTAQVSSQKDGPPKNSTAPASGISPVTKKYVIEPQDLLDVSVWDYPQFDLKVVVRPDRKIGIKLLSDVQTADLSTKQVEKLISEGLKSTKIVPNAHITMI